MKNQIQREINRAKSMISLYHWASLTGYALEFMGVLNAFGGYNDNDSLRFFAGFGGYLLGRVGNNHIKNKSQDEKRELKILEKNNLEILTEGNIWKN